VPTRHPETAVPVYQQGRPGDIRTARPWHRYAYHIKTLPPRLGRLAAELSLAEGARVLDFGCADVPYRGFFSDDVEYVAADLAGNPHATLELNVDGTVPAPDDSFDAVMSTQVLEHVTDPALYLAESFRVLRPGGRLLLCVDSLVLGLARLAEQGRWAELADAPKADVVLVPYLDGTITRCFWPEELRTLLEDTGLKVEWIRPRSVLSKEAVVRALASDPSALPTLVRTEVALAADRQGESVGIHLLASAVKQG
jgi:SAM-dependent methyltransferase